MRLANVGHFAVYVVVRAFVCLVQALSIETCDTIARWLAWLAADVARLRYRVIDENLRHAYPHLADAARRDLARRMWHHLFLFVVEVAHAPRKIHETNWRDYIEVPFVKMMLKILYEDRPVIVVSAHFGNFELAGYLLGLFGFPTYTVARRLDNPYLDRFVNRFRGATGQFIVPKKGGYDQIVNVLQSDGTMTFLADQYAGSKGCWVEFFGRPASTHKAIALFALAHDAKIVVGTAQRIDRPLHYEFLVYGVADPSSADANVSGVRELTAWYTACLEDMVRARPEQYWWLHRRWKGRPEGRRQRRAA